MNFTKKDLDRRLVGNYVLFLVVIGFWIMFFAMENDLYPLWLCIVATAMSVASYLITLDLRKKAGL